MTNISQLQSVNLRELVENSRLNGSNAPLQETWKNLWRHGFGLYSQRQQ